MSGESGTTEDESSGCLSDGVSELSAVSQLSELSAASDGVSAASGGSGESASGIAGGGGGGPFPYPGPWPCGQCNCTGYTPCMPPPYGCGGPMYCQLCYERANKIA